MLSELATKHRARLSTQFLPALAVIERAACPFRYCVSIRCPYLEHSRACSSVPLVRPASTRVDICACSQANLLFGTGSGNRTAEAGAPNRPLKHGFVRALRVVFSQQQYGFVRPSDLRTRSISLVSDTSHKL